MNAYLNEEYLDSVEDLTDLRDDSYWLSMIPEDVFVESIFGINMDLVDVMDNSSSKNIELGRKLIDQSFKTFINHSTLEFQKLVLNVMLDNCLCEINAYYYLMKCLAEHTKYDYLEHDCKAN